MSDKEKTLNSDSEKATNPKKSTSKKTSTLSQILNGEFLTKEFVLNNLTFIFFLIFLMIMIVAKGYYGKQLTNDIISTQRELDQNTAEYIEAKSKLEKITRRYKLEKRLEKRELHESQNATKVIVVKKAENE